MFNSENVLKHKTLVYFTYNVGFSRQTWHLNLELKFLYTVYFSYTLRLKKTYSNAAPVCTNVGSSKSPVMRLQSYYICCGFRGAGPVALANRFRKLLKYKQFINCT
jgi:hypothetical protein